MFRGDKGARLTVVLIGTTSVIGSFVGGLYVVDRPVLGIACVLMSVVCGFASLMRQWVLEEENDELLDALVPTVPFKLHRVRSSLPPKIEWPNGNVTELVPVAKSDEDTERMSGPPGAA